MRTVLMYESAAELVEAIERGDVLPQEVSVYLPDHMTVYVFREDDAKPDSVTEFVSKPGDRPRTPHEFLRTLIDRVAALGEMNREKAKKAVADAEGSAAANP